jgi:hypothetical protein
MKMNDGGRWIGFQKIFLSSLPDDFVISFSETNLDRPHCKIHPTFGQCRGGLNE